MLTITNLTFQANSSTLVFSGTGNGTRSFSSNTITYNNITINANSSGGMFSFANSTAPTLSGTLTVNGPNYVVIPGASTITLGGLTIAGTSSAQVEFRVSGDAGGTSAIPVSGSVSISWAALSGLAFSGGTFAASDSFDLGRNSGITITAPSSSSGGASRARAFGGF